MQIQWWKAEKIIYEYFIISNIHNTQDNMDSYSANVTTDTVLSFESRDYALSTHISHDYQTLEIYSKNSSSFNLKILIDKTLVFSH